MKKLSLILCLVGLMMLYPPICGNAHEFSPATYIGYLSKSSNSQPIATVNFYYNINTLTNSTLLRQYAKDAVNNWKNAMSSSLSFNPSELGSAFSNFDFSDAWSLSYPSTAYGICDWTVATAAIYTYAVGWTGPPSQTSVRKVVYARIDINTITTGRDSFSADDYRKTYAHEIGHALGFNDTNDATISVMRQGKGSDFGWANFWRPSSHDITDYTNKYTYRLWY